MGDYNTRQQIIQGDVYNANRYNLQEIDTKDQNGNLTVDYVDTDTGEFIESLKDDNFSWKEKKLKSLIVSDLYKMIDEAHKNDEMRLYQEATKTCSTWNQFYENIDGTKRKLHRFNACNKRMCPLCAARKAKIMAVRLINVLEEVEKDHKGIQFLFLTLTIRNVNGDDLRDALDLLTKAWAKLTKRRAFDRAVKGWFRAIEITRNRSQKTYHPHIHVILVVEDDYFKQSNGLYLSHDKWVEMWRQSLQVDYEPSVRIQRTKGKKGKTGDKKKSPAMAAAVEAAKYATKDSEYTNKSLPMAEAAEVLRTYTKALSRKRMTAMGGWVLEASQKLKMRDIEEVEDMVHEIDNSTDSEAMEIIATYGWHFFVKNYILIRRELNTGNE